MLSFQYLLNPKLLLFSKTFYYVIISKSPTHESHTPRLFFKNILLPSHFKISCPWIPHSSPMGGGDILLHYHFKISRPWTISPSSYFQKHFAALSFRNLTSMNLQHAPRLCHTQVDLINAPAYKPRQETNGPTPVTQGLQQQVHNNPQIWDFQQR